MRRAETLNDNLYRELLETLDEEVVILNRRCDQLEQLSGAITDRDSDGVEKLLDAMERAQARQGELDVKVQALRSTLAERYGLSPEEMRLGRLADLLPEEQAEQINCRRRQVMLLAEKLRQKNLEASMVLFECARLNKMLLQCLCPPERTVSTYGSGGHSTWRMPAGSLEVEG